MPTADPTDRPGLPVLGLAALFIAPFMGVLDVFIVNVAAPSIQRDLGAGFDDVQLVIGGYLLAFAMLLVTGGRIGDMYGRRRMFLWGLALFAAGSLACAAAPTPDLLVAARLLQGGAAAVMMPQVLALIQAIVPPGRRPGVLGVYGAVQSLGAISGQIVGGVLIRLDLVNLGWRTIFLINVPMCALAWFGAVARLPRDTESRRVRLDLPGVGMLAAALFLLLYPIVVGADHGWPLWSIAVPIASIAVFAAFGRWELRLSRAGGFALLPPHLFADRGFRTGAGASLALYTGNAGFYLVLAFFLQDGRGLSSLAAAIEFLPLGISFALAALASKRAHVRFGNASIYGGALVIAAGLLLSYAGSIPRGATGAIMLEPGLILCGIGQGLVIPLLIGTVLGRVATTDAGAASGGLLTMSQLGNTLGVAAIGAVFTSVQHVHGYGPAFRVGMLVLCGVAAVLFGTLVSLTRTRVPATEAVAVS
jgi:MFS family permease